MNTQPKNRMYVLVVAIVIFVAFTMLACNDHTCTSPSDTNCDMPNPANVIMGDKTSAEQAVNNLLQGDNPQNVLSGGN